MKSFRLCLLALLLVYTGNAANYHVLREATGTRDGSNWVNADTNVPVVQVAGTTYLIGRGIYALPSITNNNLSIVKATTNSHGSDTGWSDAYATLSIFTNSAVISGSSFVLDGKTGGGPSQYDGSGHWTNAFGSWSSWENSWTNAFGFLFRATVPGGSIFNFSTGATNITARHFEVWGAGPDGTGLGADCINFGYCTNVVMDNWYGHDAGRCIVFSRARDWAVGNFFTGTYESTAGEHSECFSIANLNAGGAVTNLWITNGIFNYTDGTGCIVANADNVTVEGCIFGTTVAGVYLQAWTATGQATHWYIYNNLFYGGATLGYFAGSPLVNTIVYTNNMMFYVYIGPWDANTGSAHDYNAYGDLSFSSFSGRTGAENEPHVMLNVVSNQFVDPINGDYRLFSNTIAGVSTPYTLDMLGATRSTWSRGPFEFVSNSPIIGVVPSSLNFGTLLTNTSANLSFYVTNSGNGNLTGAATVSAPYTASNGGYTNLPPNSSQTITVTFSPSTAGTYSQNVTLDGGGGETVSLTGVATNAPYFGVTTKISGAVTISGATVIK